MDLPSYIRVVGESAAAARFRVSVWTIRSWRQQSRRPRPNKAMEIVAASNGRVTLADIFGPPPADTEAA